MCVIIYSSSRVKPELIQEIVSFDIMGKRPIINIIGILDSGDSETSLNLIERGRIKDVSLLNDDGDGIFKLMNIINNSKNAEISHAEFAESLICTVNTKPAILNEKLDQLRNTAVELKKTDILNFITLCKKKFSHLLS